ncbi:Flagellar radial spoke protein 3 [Monoraphidium neglectum]|uniref:Flagellar radial spoke protein 3 n=1 Tax=Monoraphidium neglectum TaxID=145388 RepID=A0A0D2MYF1_9CHLO|nr:Flagellar radial spoke protein 3 [Monoraphidium neglectum]KIZ07515.1 Flagellar radial spoke protein 3 [Monoraphidium neglectum]|eukprot:XP_013906534.1 Flagellar radial spoke protein 3 [Monoraphidium neglectum]
MDIQTGDLFDFDVEVEPILEVLVGKVLEQGLMEVLQEEELAAMRRHQAHFESVRAAELIAAQRLEAAERRKLEERERRLRQERERKERERVVRAKVAASAFARGYLNGIVTSVFQNLQDAGFFVDPVEREVEELFMPWLQAAAVQHLERTRAAHAVVQQLVEDAVVLRAEEKAAAIAAADEEAAAAEAAAKLAVEAAAKKAAEELAAIRSRAAFILGEMQPPLVDEEQAAQARAELQTQAQSNVDAAWEAERARVGEARRAELEAEAAAASQQAAEDDDAAGAGDTADVEAEVAAAMEAVAKPEPMKVTDADVLNALIEKGVITKEALIQALAVAALSADDGQAEEPGLV